MTTRWLILVHQKAPVLIVVWNTCVWPQCPSNDSLQQKLRWCFKPQYPITGNLHLRAKLLAKAALLPDTSLSIDFHPPIGANRVHLLGHMCLAIRARTITPFHQHFTKIIGTRDASVHSTRWGLSCLSLLLKHFPDICYLRKHLKLSLREKNQHVE